MSTRLYVGNLPFSASDEDLQQMFSEVGQVVSAQVVIDRETGRSRGFGFVEMSKAEEAQAAVRRFDQTQMKGRAITVNEARPRSEGGGGGRGGYGGGGGGGRGGRGGHGGGGGGGYGGGGGRGGRDDYGDQRY